jgi:hypothetical protein
MDDAGHRLPRTGHAADPDALEVGHAKEDVAAAEQDDDLAALDAVDAQLEDRPDHLRRLRARRPAQREQRQDQDEQSAGDPQGPPVMDHRQPRRCRAAPSGSALRS